MIIRNPSQRKMADKDNVELLRVVGKLRFGKFSDNGDMEWSGVLV